MTLRNSGNRMQTSQRNSQHVLVWGEQGAGEALAGLIEPVVAKLKPLAENPPASFSGDARARLWHAYALGEDRLGEERGDNARLVTAIAYDRKVLDDWRNRVSH